jgi:hypothetical protein
MRQVFMPTLAGECGGGGRQAVCTPQSVLNVHIGSSEALGLEPRSTFMLLSSSMDLYERFSVWASEKLPW